MKLKLALLTSFLYLSLGFAQEKDIETEYATQQDTKVKRLSLGIKLGIPSIASGAGEVVLPFLNNHIAPYLDYGKTKFTLEDAITNYSFFEYGVNFYTGKKGYGFFIGIGKSALNSEVNFKNLDFGIQGAKGTATVPFDLETKNLRVGVKTGGTIYFKFDLGYGIGDVPETINFTASSNGITKGFSEDLPPLPGVGSSSILLGSIGLGFSF